MLICHIIFAKYDKQNIIIINKIVNCFRYRNRPNMTFDDTNCVPDQEFDLQPDHTGELEYATKSVLIISVCFLLLDIIHC